MNDADRIEEGRAAWGRVRRGATFADWLKVAIALAVGREHCLHLAGANRPFGKRYNFAMGQWLRENGFDGISGQERHMCLKVLDAREAIEAWRSGLTEQKRRRLNHPGACYWAWRRSISRRRRQLSLQCAATGTASTATGCGVLVEPVHREGSHGDLRISWRAWRWRPPYAAPTISVSSWPRRGHARRRPLLGDGTPVAYLTKPAGA
jgi:hypothetical protein